MNISNGLMPVPSLAGQDERPLVENLHICIYPIWILPVAGLGHSVYPVTAPGSWVSPISGTWDPQPCSISSDAVTHRHVQTSALRTHMHTSLSLSLIPPLNIPKLILCVLQIPFLVSSPHPWAVTSWPVRLSGEMLLLTCPVGVSPGPSGWWLCWNSPGRSWIRLLCSL